MDLLAEIGMREWLIGGGVLLVLAVLLDGFRRMRAERRSGIKMSLGMGGGFADDAPYGTELPNGGARVIRRTDPIISDAIFSEESTDDLMPASEEFEASLEQWRQEHAEADAGDHYQNNEQVSGSAFVGDREILVMHVKSKEPEGFNGSDLLQVLLACDMRYGDKDILHRHEQADGKGSLQFSVANMLEPGIFNLEDINSFRTPGVTFFMTLPGPQDAGQAFECMIETANCLVKNLNAVLIDEDHSTATLQVISHYRERIKRFNFQQQSAVQPA